MSATDWAAVLVDRARAEGVNIIELAAEVAMLAQPDDVKRLRVRRMDTLFIDGIPRMFRVDSRAWRVSGNAPTAVAVAVAQRIARGERRWFVREDEDDDDTKRR